MSIYCIYQAVNTSNGKSYIGFTYNFKRRKSNHIYGSKTPKTIFHKAIHKYTPNLFKWQILYMSKDKEHCIKVMEDFFIKEYNTMIPNGYNTCNGGGGGIVSQTLIERMQTDNPMTKLRVNNGSFKVGESKLFTEEHINNIRKSKLGSKNINYKNKEASKHLNELKYKCDYCGIITSKGNISRWHNSKCKLYTN